MTETSISRVHRGGWCSRLDGVTRTKLFRDGLTQRVLSLDPSLKSCTCSLRRGRLLRSVSLLCRDSPLEKENTTSTPTPQACTGHTVCRETDGDTSALSCFSLPFRCTIFCCLSLLLLLPSLLSLALACFPAYSTALDSGFKKGRANHCKSSFTTSSSLQSLCHSFSVSVPPGATAGCPLHLTSAAQVLNSARAACKRRSVFVTAAEPAAIVFPAPTVAARIATAVCLARVASLAATAAPLPTIAAASAPVTSFIRLPSFPTTTTPLCEPNTSSSKKSVSASATAACLLRVPRPAIVSCFLRSQWLKWWPVGLSFADTAEVNAAAARSATPAAESALIATAGQPAAAKAAAAALEATAATSPAPTERPAGWATDFLAMTASSLPRGARQQEKQKQPQRQRRELFFGTCASHASDREGVGSGSGRVAPRNLHFAGVARYTSSACPSWGSSAAGVAGPSANGAAYEWRSAVEASSAVDASGGFAGASGKEEAPSFSSSSSSSGPGGFSFILPKGGGVVSSNDLRNGSCVVVNSQPYRVLQFQSVKMARAAAYVRARLKNLLTGATIDHSFRSDEKLQIPEITVVNATFSGVRPGAGGRNSSGDAAAAAGGRKKGGFGGRAAAAGNTDFKAAAYSTTHRGTTTAATDGRKGRGKVLVFLNTETWEEVLISDRETVERIEGFLQDGMEVKLGIWEDKILDVALPPTATYVVSEVSGSRLEQRGNPGRKQAILETGARISVPHFICEGDRVVVRTATGDFVKRL